MCLSVQPGTPQSRRVCGSFVFLYTRKSAVQTLVLTSNTPVLERPLNSPVRKPLSKKPWQDDAFHTSRVFEAEGVSSPPLSILSQGF